MYEPIALPADFDGVDMLAVAATLAQPCSRCGHKHSGGVIVRDGSVLCQHCGFNSQARVAAKLKHRRRAAAKAKRERRARAKRPERVRVIMPMPTSTRRPREHRAAPHGRDGGTRDDGGGDGDSDGGGGEPPPPRSGAPFSGRVSA
jgi:uncharacterized Zn finger protein (UPF0148 family)